MKLERIEAEKQRLRAAAENSVETLRRASVESKERLKTFVQKSKLKSDYLESEQEAMNIINMSDQRESNN